LVQARLVQACAFQVPPTEISVAQIDFIVDGFLNRLALGVVWVVMTEDDLVVESVFYVDFHLWGVPLLGVRGVITIPSHPLTSQRVGR
jgi:hypothetical protein